MIKKINNIKKLQLGNKFNEGSCSEIFEYNNMLFKLFNEDYRNLKLNINLEFFNTLNYLSNIEGLKNIITPIDIFCSKTKLYGYTMTKVNGELLSSLKEDIFLNNIFNSFFRLLPEISILSNSYIKTEDIGGDNILYDKDNLYLIDLDLSLIDRTSSAEELYIRTSYNIFYSILLNIFGSIQKNVSFYYDLMKFKHGEYFDYEFFCNKLIEYYSTLGNYEVKTITDIRKVYYKTK